MATIDTETFCGTKTRGHKTVCTICGKDITGKARATREQMDEAFREMDGLFDKMSALFKKVWP